MIETGFNARVKVQQVIQNHLPEYITSEFPKLNEFLKQYYISQEYQGGTIDIAENLDQYLKLDNLTPEVINDTTVLENDVDAVDTIITVSSTKGYPQSYGLLKIDDEIITYTGITTNTFVGCIRGFSGVTKLDKDNTFGELEFSTSSAADHKKNSSNGLPTKVINLSTLFLKEFYKKLKFTLAPGLESSEFYPEVNVNSFIKSIRSFYQAKGTKESINILFKVLYGVDISVIDLETFLSKPSSAKFNRTKIISAELISGQNPFNLIGQTLRKSTDDITQASITDIEIYTNKLKTYYKISLFLGYGDIEFIEGDFGVPGKTRVLETTPINSKVISVDSTIGFPSKGSIICENNVITYTDKTVNQFLNCSGITEDISIGSEIRFDEVVYGYENGDVDKRVEFRITGSISTLEYGEKEPQLSSVGDKIIVKNIGEKIENPAENKTYKQLFANSLIYNTSTTYEVNSISGSIFQLKSSIDKSSLKVGDYVDIILTKNKNVVISDALVASTNEIFNQINLDNISQFSPVFGEKYSIRRKLKKAYSNTINLQYGNKVLISDVQNLYVDGDDYAYIASNSLPSYEIKTKVTSSKIDLGYNTSNIEYFQGYNVENESFSILSFNEPVKFITGDRVVYYPENNPLPGLNPGQSYYVQILESTNKIRLYLSLSFIGSDNFVYFKENEESGSHTFVLYKDRSLTIGPQKLLKKISLNPNVYTSQVEKKQPGSIGLLLNGVKINSPQSYDKFYYGPITEVQVINSGSDYDVVNPPKLIVDSPLVGSGTTALVVPVIRGVVSDVLVDKHDFEIENVNYITISGGNGNGAILEPVLDTRFNEVLFDARDVYEGGGLDFVNEAISFKSVHNFKNGEEIYYSNNGNPSIGIGSFEASNASQGIFLSNGSKYYAKVLNTKAVQLYPNLLSFNLGINTVGFTTINNGGIHKFRTRTKKILKDVKVVNPGENYTSKKLYVSSSGINTQFNSIEVISHDFNDGDIVEYLYTGSPISGLSTTNSYYVSKVNNDSFKLIDVGVGATNFSNYERRKYVSLLSSGSDYHIFKYPDIKLDISVSYANTSSINQKLTLTPVVRGSIEKVQVYNGGSKYGSEILNTLKGPNIKVQGGYGAEVRPIINEGKIVAANVLFGGKEYYSVPDLIVRGDGIGCVLRAVVENKKLKRVEVINSGTGYTKEKTTVSVTSPGSGSIFRSLVKSLTINNVKRFGSEYLEETTDGLSYSILDYNDDLFNLFSEDPIKHSQIIGWAFDGNPIYGPYGYSNPNDISSQIKLMESGYDLSPENAPDRPANFPLGYFIEDFKFNNSGDLDIFNGRFCRTPEFPNGVYAYFATIVPNNLEFNYVGSYPYFIGDFYRGETLSENKILDQSFDFNSSSLSRNTFPYKIKDQYAGSEFLLESNEFVDQITKIQSITSGPVENLKILNPGKNYKVGDICVFESANGNGGGLSAQVSELKGIDIVDINTSAQVYNNVVLQWNNNNIIANYTPYHNLSNSDLVNITGLTTSSFKLGSGIRVGVQSSFFTLLSPMSLNIVSGYVEDIKITPIKPDLKVGTFIKIENEVLKILDIFRDQSIIRVRRADTGLAHTASTPGVILENNFVINLKSNVDYFDSKINNLVYFNPIQTLGIGTFSGKSTGRTYTVGGAPKSISVDAQSIYVPNHPFTTGEQVILRKRPGTASIIAVSTPGQASFNIPPADSTFQTLYVINKSKDYVGLTTQLNLIRTTGGLYFLDPTPDGYEYSLENNYKQVKCEVSKVVSRVAVATNHNLVSGDIVKLNVQPKKLVGIGVSNIVRISYNEEYNKILVDPVGFSSENVNVLENKISVTEHQFKTGDQIFYNYIDEGIVGLSSRSYYAYKFDNNTIQICETFFDSISNPPILLDLNSIGGANQQISLVNPDIKVAKNSGIIFDVSSETLNGYNLKFYSDKDFNKEYYGKNETIIGIGTVGGGLDARVILKYNSDYDGKLYYNLEKDENVIRTFDNYEQGNLKIIFEDSKYNGTYNIFGIGSTTFNINLSVYPEQYSYSKNECDVIEYYTKSKNTSGGIHKLEVTNFGFGYNTLPELKKIISTDGKNANIVAESSKIGNINKYQIVDQGFEYYSDNTLRPEAYIYPVVFLNNSQELESIDITYSGKNYSSPPKLLVRNTDTKDIVDFNSISCQTPYGSVSEVKIEAPIYGLSSSEHEIICVDNTNGVGISSISTSGSGIATCTLITPILNGFLTPPFAIGDSIFVENILNEVPGTGYNSKDYEYEYFRVTNYENSNPAVVEFDVSGLSTNPGIAKQFQAGYATIVNKKNIPTFKLNQKYSKFISGEKLLVKRKVNDQFTLSDLTIQESKKDFIKVSGSYIDYLENDSYLKGKQSGAVAVVSSILKNSAKFSVKSMNENFSGWSNDIGKLNEFNQVLPDNDYYQNLSYSIKGPINFETFIDPVNRLVHVSGLKNFGDLQVEKSTGVGRINASSTSEVIVDVINERRVDTINNYLYGVDYDIFNDGTSQKSKFIQVNKSLVDYILCVSNRVLSIDDFSKKFANKDSERDLFTDVYTFLESDVYSRYLIQIIDATNKNYSLSELVIFIINDRIYTFERFNLRNGRRLGDFLGLVDSNEIKRLRFTPDDPYDTDYDIKVIRSSFENISQSSNVGINTLKVGCIDLITSNKNVGIGSTANILKLPKNNISGFVADFYVFDTVRFNTNIVEVVVSHDGENTFMSEYYLDDQVGISSNYFAIFDSKIEGNDLYLNVYNDAGTEILVNGSIVGFANTSSGIGTSRFLIPGQPPETERSAKYVSNYTISSGISTVVQLDTFSESSVKSTVRVSYGNTSAIHQVICVQNESDIFTEQYPFLTVGDSAGIGTFGGEYDGLKFNLKFYPDEQITDKLLIQSYNQIFYTFSDYENAAEDISAAYTVKYGNNLDKFQLAAYDGLNGPRANRLDFDAKHLGKSIYQKTFNPSSTIDYENNILNIESHFFNTGERLLYTPVSTFIGIGASPIGIVTDYNSSGILTTYLPSDIYAIRINENQIQLATTKENALVGTYVTFTSNGGGNAHQLEMTKKLEKTVLTIDGIVQSPLSYIGIKYKVQDNYGQVSASTTYFALSGISTIQPTDILKVNNEYMKVLSVGTGTTFIGPITPGIGTFQLINVKRGFVGTSASVHADFSDAYVYRGNYNITNSRINFTDPPRGSARDIRDLSNLPFPKSTFSGRVFLRQDYTTNTLYDNISSQFTGIDQYYNLTVQGINTTGIETGSGVVFINGVFQTPSTENNQNNNYRLEQTVGITSIVFTGITSSNGEIVNSIFDVNQNLLPRGGLIVSLGSSQGLGFAPLVGASVTAVINPSTGAIVSVGLGTTDIVGSGYNKVVSIGVTDSNHTGTAAVITTTVGAGGSLAFNVISGGSGYTNPIIRIPEPSYSNLEVVGVSRRGIGNTTETGKNMLISVEVGQNSLKLPGRNTDASNLIDANKVLIAEVAVGIMTSYYSGFSVPGGNQNCVDDIVDVLESISYNLKYGGNDKVYDAAKIYIDNAYLSGEEQQSIYAYHEARNMAIRAMRNQEIDIKRIISGRNADASRLIDQNKQLIAEVAVGRMLDAFPGFSIDPDNQSCIDDIIDVLKTIIYNLKYGGNERVFDAAQIYIDNDYLTGEETESAFAFEQARVMAIQAMRNQPIDLGGYTALTQYFDNTIEGDISGIPGDYNIGDCSDIESAITQFVGIVTTAILESYIPSSRTESTDYYTNQIQYFDRTVIGDVSGVPGVYGPNDCADVESAITSFVGIVTYAIGTSTIPATKTVAPGSLFEVKSFKIERAGYGFQYGDIFKPVGLVTAKGLNQPLAEFELEVTETFNDTFAAWQFGELDYIDSIRNLQDGFRKRFPLYYNGQLLSFEKDPANAQFPVIDLNQVLLIFVNGVIQQPGYAYEFNGGSSFIFKEPPKPDARIAIFFYRGTRESDSIFVNVNETIKRGDDVQIRKLGTVSDTFDQDIRRVEELVGSDVIETNIYTGVGITDSIERPLDWIKQKRDIIINGEVISKSRDSLEGQIYPTAKIIQNVKPESTKVFVDDAQFFSYEEVENEVPINKFSGLVVYGEDPVSAAITAIVSTAGTVSALSITNPGFGYTAASLDVKISAPKRIGVGIGTTATAIATVVNGSIVGPITIVDPGFGYDRDTPPQVIVTTPSVSARQISFKREAQLVPISKGFSGIVTGITTTTGTNGNPLALKFFLRRSPTSETFDDLQVGYPIYISNTSVGTGVTSIDSSDSSIVAIGTQFVDNIYYIHNILKFGPEAEIITNIKSSTNISGITTFSNYLRPIGKFSWGVLSKVEGSAVSIAVTGFTCNSGLTSFPTIQRRDFGLRDNGSLRKFFV